MSKKKTTNSVNPRSWAAKYAAQRQETNDQIYGYVDPYLQKNEAEISREIGQSILRSERFNADPDAYVRQELDQLQSERKKQIEKYDNDQPFSEEQAFRNAVETFNEQEIGEKSPTTSDYAKNAWAYHGRKMNDFQIGSFQGYIDRTNYWKELSEGVSRSWEIEDRVNQINNEIDSLRMQPMRSQEDVLNINQQIQDLLFEQEQLTKEHDNLKPVRDAFDSYIPSGIKSRYYDLFAGNADEGGISNIFSNNSIFGRTSQLHDEMGDFLRFTSQLYTPGITRERQKEILKTALKTADDKIKEWQNGIDLNIKDRERYQKVSDYYKDKFDKGGTDFFSADTWLYGLPGLVAGSTSGMSKIIPAMLLGIATGGGTLAAGAAYGTLGALGAGTAGYLATAAFNYGAGIAENNSEVAEAYNERIKDYLQHESGKNGTLYDDIILEGRKKLNLKNATDDEVFEQFRRGSYDINNAAANKKMMQLATGIENQFQDDMMATTYGALFESALEVIPFGRVVKVPRSLRYVALSTSKGRKFMRGETLSNLKEGFIVGSSINPVMGALYAPAHVFVRPILNKAGRVGKVVLDNISEATGISKFIPEQTFTRKFLNEPRKRYIKDIGGRWILSSIEEGVEEGKQHISAEKYKSGEYSSAVIKSIGETCLDDFLAGSKSAGLILATVTGMESILPPSDRETLKEIKGGMLLGGIQTGIVNTASQYAPYSSEMSARDAIVNTVLSEKASAIDALNKGKVYAEASKSSSSFKHLKDAFNVLREKNEDEYKATGEYAIGKEYIDEEEKEFERVAKIANDAYTIKQAAAQGIQRGTEEYNNFVAHKALAEKHLEEETDVLNMARENYNAKNDEVQNSFLTQELQRRSALIPGEEQKENDEDEVLSGEDLLRTVNDYVRTRTVAEYTALLKRKQELEVGIDNARRSGKKSIERILQKQLNNVNSLLKVNKSAVVKLTNPTDATNLDNVEDIERDLITDRTDHDELVDLYRQVLLATDDYDLAKEQYDRIIGIAYLDDKELAPGAKFDMNNDIDRIIFKNGQAKKIMKATQDTVNDDDDFLSVFLQDFQDRTDDEGNEIISPEEKQEIEEEAPKNNPEEEFKKEVLAASGVENKPESTITEQPVVQSAETPQEKPVDAIQSHSKPVSPAQPTITPETSQTSLEQPKTAQQRLINAGISMPDDAGHMLHKRNEFKSEGRMDSLEARRAILTIKSALQNPNMTWQKLHDILVNANYVMTVNGLTYLKNALQAVKDGKITVDDVLTLIHPNLEDGAYILTTKQESVAQNNENQRRVVEELHRRAELSKSRIKKVTSDYYLIQIGDELIQMPRVHSVMPKYWYQDGSYAAALQLGNAFDNLARMFFADVNNINLYEQNPEKFVNEWFNLPVSEDPSNPNSLDKTYNSLYTSKKAFANTIKDLYELAKQYRDLGWVLSTDKIVWYSEFESGWVAGETDMIAVDKDGNIHIVDFKTASGLRPFERYANADIYRTNKYQDLLSTLTEDDFKAGPRGKGLSKAARSIKNQIQTAEGRNKNIIITWEDNSAVLRYADSDYYNNNSKFRSGPKSDEYSDQLTAYAEMIQKQLANVVDLEVVGFRTTYTTDEKNNLLSVSVLENQVNGKPFRIKVSFSDKMRGILNNEGAPVQPVETPNIEVVESKNEAEAVQQTQQAQAVNNDKAVPKKTATAPNEQPAKTPERLGYSNINPTLIERDKELAKLTASPSFINDCLQNGLIELYTEEVKGKPEVYARITYGGKTYERIFIWANSALLQKVQDLEKDKKDGQRIVATAIKRTGGKIIKQEGGKSVVITETSLLAGVNLKDLEFTSSDGRFGFINDGNLFSFDNGDINQPRILQTGMKQPNGTIAMRKNLNYKENPTETTPITVARKTFKDSADFIIESLKQINTIDQQIITTINGKSVNTGISRKQALSLLLPIVNNVGDAESYALFRDPVNPSVFHVVMRTLQQPIVSVNMLDQQSVNNFKQFLQNTQMALHNKVLVSRIGKDQNNVLSIFKSVKKFFGQHGETDSLVITPDIKFDRSDIQGDGLSGFAWYIKNGRLITDFKDIEAPLVSVGDAGYFGEVKVDTPINKVPTISEEIGTSGNDVIDIQFSDFLNKRLTEKDKDKPKLTEEQIKKNLRPILGNEVDDPTVIKIIMSIATDPRLKDASVVGLAHSDGIKISGAAFEGVEYHEAFHRIFELFVPSVMRDKVYDYVSKQLGLDLSKDSKDNKYLGHRLVAEHVADKYMDYKAGEWNTRFSLLNKVFNWIRDFVNAFFRISDRQMYQIFRDVNSGKYRSERRKGKYEAEKKRFKDLFGELNYEVHGQEFTHLMNDPMYEDAKNTAFYCIMLGQDIDVSGKHVSDTRINRQVFMNGADRLLKEGYDIFGTQVEPDQKTMGQLVMSEIYSKFEAVSDDIAAMFANISTDYKKTRREETEEDLDGDEVSIASAWDDNFFKWDYEFSRFDKSTSRVKYFFASIPDMYYDEYHNLIPSTNGLGMPQMLPMKYVFNEALSHLWDIDTLDELVQRLWKLSHQDPMWSVIALRVQNLLTKRNDADVEALLTQLMNTIRSNRHTFMLAKAVENSEGVYTINMQTSDADYNAREYPIQWSQVLSKGGSDILKINQNGQLVFNPNNPEAALAFQKIASLFDFSKASKDGKQLYVGLKQMLSDAPTKQQKILILWDVIGTEDYVFNEYSDVSMIEATPKPKRNFVTRAITDLNDPTQLAKVKRTICESLNAIGINIHVHEFDYMLTHKYGSADADALRQMVNSVDEKDSMGSFLYFLNTISNGKSLNIDKDGNVRLKNGRAVKFENVFENLAFIKELGNWKYQYRHSKDELTVLATGNNRFYEMSDNDLFSDTLRSLNKRTQWYEDLKQDVYNYYTDPIPDANGEYHSYGSYVLDQLTKNPELKLQLQHLIGFKTDKQGDTGQDYFEISRREDYLSKVAILESGGILSLTLSDKKKYVYFQGVKLPGLDYSNILDQDGNIIPDAQNAIQKTHSEQDGGIDQLDSVVTQFLSYAKSEYESIKHAITNPVNVKNYKDQGKRFSSLLGIWEDTYDKDGNYTGEQFISFNDNTKSWEENLGIAEAYFFDRTEDEQKALIKRNLNKVLDKELSTAESLGLIQKVGNNSNKYLNYKNVGLNNIAIASLTNAYMSKYPGISQDIAQSIAVVVYLNDISNKAIMSGQEMERLMSGNPAFYKWKYNDRGELIDRTVDELKRLGGLGSTGTNNFTELENIPDKYKEGKYRCAEVDNEEIASPQLDYLRENMYASELRQNVIQDILENERNLMQQQLDFDIKTIRGDREMTPLEKEAAINERRMLFTGDLKALKEDIADRVDKQSIEELESAYKDSELLILSKEKAEAAANSFAGKIDVADGGAYITDEMCETLLRMEGSWSKEIEEAFDILKGRKKVDYLGQSEAYQKVLTTVIGNQKYTAFGRRLQNGVSIPYYHKMALFPIFECIATGKMSNVFDKMKEQGIDMLLINSAVKVGSQGSKPIVWSEFREDDNAENANNFSDQGIDGWSWKPTFKDSFNFNTYDVDFSYLRKQLNTDPKEDEMLRMGTQAQKIIFSNLFQGREYTTQAGEKIRGEALQQRIMNSMNSLSDLGVQKLNKRFFVTDKDGNLIDAAGNVIEDPNSSDRQIDIEKFAKEVSRLMSDRGADKNVMKALEIISTEMGKETSIPLGAISNASWLESVLISMINKDVVDVNTPGAFFIQRSVWAMQGRRMYSRDKGNIVGRQIYNGKRLEMINEEGSMDCVLSLDYFQHILPKVQSDEFEEDENGDYVYVRDKNGQYKKDKNGNYIAKRKMRDMSFDEARQWLLDNGIIGGSANIIAYRIPTQAESSIHALRCVDVLPVVRDTVILPEEFTKITGSDFDIDKLGLSTINWNIDGKNKASDEFEEGSEQYYQNRLIRDFITLLLDKNTINILHRSIDNDTKLLTDIVKELEGGSTNIEMPYNFYSLATQTERKNDYITGKIGIGPFALNNNNHILTMLYDVRFKDIPGTIMSTLGLTNLASVEDQDHNSVMSWISALINAHVDIAKDPYISKLNVNPYTYNLVNTLIRTGFGKNTFYFTTQPIMKELAQVYMNAASSYMANKNKTQYQLQKEAVEELAKGLFADLSIGKYKYEDLVEIVNPENSRMREYINNIFKAVVDDGVLRKNANKEYQYAVGATITANGEDLQLNKDQIQLIVYLANLQFDPYARSVSNLVKYSKIDTKKHGKSYIEQKLYERGFNELFFDKDGTGLFDEFGIRRMARESYIETKTINAIKMTENILKGQFLQATPAFNDAISSILSAICRSGSKDVDLNNKISRIIMAAVKSEFINDYAAKLCPNNPTYIRDLVSESEETFEFSQQSGQKNISLKSRSNYNLSSYVGGRAFITFDAAKGVMNVGQTFDGGVFVVNVINNQETSTYTLSAPIIGVNEELNEISTPITRKSTSTGTIRLTKGKNTISDRFDRLLFDIKNDSRYSDVLDQAGEPINMLLRSLVHGRTFDYTAPVTNLYSEMPDTYANLKFLKLFNALDQNGIESNYIIDGWDELLHDNKHPLLKEFAEDLVVYAFITSGDQGGFTKMFKQVPFSWRKESGYGDFIKDKIRQFESEQISKEVLRDAILNNWFDNDIVRTYYFTKTASDGKTQLPQFIVYSGETAAKPAPQYNPLIIAALALNERGVYEPSIDANNAPMFIKIPRRNYKAAKDSQRAYTVYEKVDTGMKIVSSPEANNIAATKWVRFPIYVKVEPKGNQLKGNYLITEYGRSDARISEKTPNREALSKAYKLGDFISRQVVEDMKNKWSQGYADILESLNNYNVFVNKFNGNIREFNKALSNPSNNNGQTNISVIVDTVDSEGFHEDEVYGVVTGIIDISDGYMVSLKIENKTYNIKLDQNYNIKNKNSKFSDIYDYDGQGNRISLKDLIRQDGEYVDFEEGETDQIKLTKEEQKEAEEYKGACEGGKV